MENNENLDGLETYYYDFNNKQVNQLIALVDKYSLLTSGGSDCHGINKTKEPILAAKNSVSKNEEWVVEVNKPIITRKGKEKNRNWR